MTSWFVGDVWIDSVCVLRCETKRGLFVCKCFSLELVSVCVCVWVFRVCTKNERVVVMCRRYFFGW